MDLYALEEAVRRARLYPECRDGVVKPHHHEIPLLAGLRQRKLPDILKIEEQPPLIHLPRLCGPRPLRIGELLRSQAVSRQGHASLQFHELRLGDDQHVAQVAQSGDIFGAVMQGREGEGDLPLAQMLEKLRDQLVSEGLSYLGSSELLLADRTGEKSQRLGQRPAHSRHLWPLLKPQLFQVDEVVPAVGVQHPVTDDLPHRDIQVLFEEGDEGEGLRVETFIREHDLDKGETIVLGFSHLELPLAEAPPHEALLVVDLERLAILLFGEVEEANHRGLLPAPPDKALGHLVGLQVDHLLVFVATEREHAVVHAPSLLH